MNEITPFIFRGNFDDAKDVQKLIHKKIDIVISVFNRLLPLKTIKLYELNGIKNYQIQLEDCNDPNMKESFHKVHDLILSNPKSKILVHCHAGISRSASSLIYHLMIQNDWNYDQAHMHIKRRRNIIEPNYWFQNYLQTFKPLKI